ncbi:MAG TPA: DUF692 domain-containing protein [Kofleriaceae bacterium]|nr:DUF692 domain-containing protein [Kofleriaceae bacterium]
MGMRPELAADLLARPGVVDFVEVVAETCYTQRQTRREAQAMAEIWPVIPHGVKLSLGSADGVDLDRARRLGALARELRAPMISEHASFTRAGGYEIGHLTQLPRTREAVAAVARNVARVRGVLPDVPLVLENVAWSVLWPGDGELDEASFYQEIVAHTGCELLLDVGNLYANARNEGKDPSEVLAGYPLDRVAMVHVAGGVVEHGFYYDTHAHPVPDRVFDLVARVRAARPDVPVMIERDANFAFPELAGELARLRELPRGAPRPARMPAPLAHGEADLAGAQTALAAALVAPVPADDRALAGIDRASIVRARDILHRKRIDDALPLLGRLSRSQTRTRDLAAAVLARHARPVQRAGPTDAWRIAEAALGDPELGDDAAIDHLVLRARFARSASKLVPRRAPFIGFARLGDGARMRATKGFGALAEVMLRRER